MTSTDRFRLARAAFTWTPQDANVDTITLVRGSLPQGRGSFSGPNTRTSALISMPITPRCSVLKMPVVYPLRSSSTVSSPAVDRLFADEYPIQAVVNKQDLLDAISRVALVAERNAPIRMMFTGHGARLVRRFRRRSASQ